MSVGGVVTYPAAVQVREAVARIPEALLLVETDSPYMTPHTDRGKRNEPANLPRVVEAVAAVRGADPDRAASRTAENARRCFGL
ncbi:putative metal-dependent hydrolase TatD [bacterium HR32]|nr:putative metal-dependent hydrolase TatD [bacterium HR32]